MTPLSVAAMATTPGTSLLSTARRSAASIWARDCAEPPCATARPTMAPTEAVAVSAAAVLRKSRRVCCLLVITFPPIRAYCSLTLPPSWRGVFRQLRGDVGEGDLERGSDVDHARLARGERLLQCRLQPRR